MANLALLKLKLVNFIYRYNRTTGSFTVPPGGDGYYYFSSHLLFTNGEYGRFDIRINGEVLCTVEVDQQETLTDDGQQDVVLPPTLWKVNQ